MTRNRMHILYRGTLLLALGAGLASCGSNNNNTVTTPPPIATPPAPPVQVAKQEDQFGSVFATDFRAMMNGEPATVNDGDIVAISLTTEPVMITD